MELDPVATSSDRFFGNIDVPDGGYVGNKDGSPRIDFDHSNGIANLTGDFNATGEISNPKGKITLIGGFACKLTNNTGSDTIAGQLVLASSQDDSFEIADADSQEAIGAVLDAGIPDGEEAWIVGGGIADVLIDSGGSSAGDRMITSSVPGSADVWNVGGAVAVHFQEIGHCLETRVGAGLARCKLHFN